jgi:hypothetical protein
MKIETKEKASGSDNLNSLVSQRDNLIIAIWKTMKEISKIVDIEEMSKEDFEVWSAATQHSAIQKRLG